MTNQLDSALAELATKLGTTVQQIGPEVVKAYGGSLHAAAHLYGVFLVGLLLVTVFMAVVAFIRESDGLGITAIIPGIATIVVAFCYCDAVIRLASYNASPVGATAGYLIGK